MTTDVKKNSLQAWWMAIRIKTLCVPSAAVFSATLLAQNEKFPINGWLAFDVLAVALLITMATNLVNDGMDFFKGKDTVHRLGFKRVSQSGLLPPLRAYQAGIGLFFLAAIASIPLMFQGNIFCILIPLSIAAGYCYTGGSYPLSIMALESSLSWSFLDGSLPVVCTTCRHRNIIFPLLFWEPKWAF